MQFYSIRYIVSITLLSCSILGCGSSEKSNREFTYFGGEIVNPNTNYIVLSKADEPGDTILLDRNNRFFHKIENLKEGLYSFKHAPENQLVILEKGDSVLIRLNTLEFDESLVFTGDGARKNNFLIEMYLQNEIERERLRRTDLKLSPTYFKRNQDSLLKPKLVAYNKLTNKCELSPLAKKVTQACFTFDYFTRHELYFHSRYGIGGLDSTMDLPKAFFDYRKDINYSDHDLEKLYSYNRYLNYYFTNTSLSNAKDTKNIYKGRLGSTIHKLDHIDSIIDHPYIKNNLLRRVTTNFLLNSKNNKDSDIVLNHYLSVSSNKKSQRELKKLAKAIARLRPNKVIPDQELISSKGERTKLSALFNKPITALYFWSMESKDHYIRAHKKASYLSALYPEIDFIAINTDDDQTKNWLKTIKRHHYNLGMEYEFKYPKCSSEELVIHSNNKVILVDQEGKIINAKANLFSSVFERQLMQYTRLASLE